MKYNGPYDQPSVPDAPYKNGNPTAGIQGSIPPASAFEYPQREIVNYIKDNLLVPSNLDLHQFSRGLQNSAVLYGIDIGTANALVVVLQPIPTKYTAGMTVRIKKSASGNTGALTLDIGAGATDLLKADGSPFTSGQMPGNMVFEATWDGTAWKTINFLGSQATTETVTNNYNVNIPYCVDTSTTPNSVIAPYSPPITSVAAGDIISVKLNRTFTGGPVTISVNAMSSKNIKRGDGQDPYKGDGFQTQILLLEFDGTNFQIINSLLAAAPLPILLADRKSDSINGGTFTANAWRTRDLNTIVADPFGLSNAGLVTISNNQFTLGPGNWIMSARCPCVGVSFHQARIFNITDNILVVKGGLQIISAALSYQSSDPTTTYAFVDGAVYLTSPKTFEIQHICAWTQANWGYGSYDVPSIFGPGLHCPGPETYTTLYLTWSR